LKTINAHAGTYYKYEELRRHPNGIVATRTFFDASFAITLIVEQASRLSGQRSAVDCRAYSFFFELTLIGSELCFFLLSYDLYVALRNPFVNYKSNLKKYIVFVFLMSVIMASILVGTGPDGKILPAFQTHLCLLTFISAACSVRHD
jgi:hypothetical protein